MDDSGVAITDDEGVAIGAEGGDAVTGAELVFFAVDFATGVEVDDLGAEVWQQPEGALDGEALTGGRDEDAIVAPDHSLIAGSRVVCLTEALFGAGRKYPAEIGKGAGRNAGAGFDEGAALAEEFPGAVEGGDELALARRMRVRWWWIDRAKRRACVEGTPAAGGDGEDSGVSGCDGGAFRVAAEVEGLDGFEARVEDVDAAGDGAGKTLRDQDQAGVGGGPGAARQDLAVKGNGDEFEAADLLVAPGGGPGEEDKFVLGDELDVARDIAGVGGAQDFVEVEDGGVVGLSEGGSCGEQREKKKPVQSRAHTSIVRSC